MSENGELNSAPARHLRQPSRWQRARGLRSTARRGGVSMTSASGKKQLEEVQSEQLKEARIRSPKRKRAVALLLVIFVLTAIPTLLLVLLLGG